MLISGRKEPRLASHKLSRHRYCVDHALCELSKHPTQVKEVKIKLFSHCAYLFYRERAYFLKRWNFSPEYHRKIFMYFYICLIITLNILFAHGKKDLKKKRKERNALNPWVHTFSEYKLHVL